MERLFLSSDEHNEFIKNHKNGDMCQLTYWGDLKSVNGWHYESVAVGNNGKPTGVALLLFKKLPKFSLTFCYCSRGFVVDWDDQETIEVLIKEVAKVAKKHKAILVRMDPDIDESNTFVIDYLKGKGFVHKGLELGLHTYTQPRLHAITDISPDLKDVMKNFQSRTRTNVRKSLKNGLIFEDAPLEKMDVFYDIMKTTGDRDSFTIRGLDYFQQMYKAMNPTGDCKLFLIKLDPKEAQKTLLEDISKREREEKKLLKKDETDGTKMQLAQIRRSLESSNEKLKEMEDLENTNPDGIYLSGSIYTQSGGKAYYLYGASSNQYRDLLPNYFMQWKMMEYAKEHGATSYDFGGITGKEGRDDDEAPGLYEFKKRWGSIARGRIGEFDLVMKPFLYFAMEKAIAFRKYRTLKKNGVTNY